MTARQKFEACVILAPNFRIGIEYLTMPSVARALVWHGRRPADMAGLSAGILFPAGLPFEPLFDELLTRAFATLQGPLAGLFTSGAGRRARAGDKGRGEGDTL